VATSRGGLDVFSVNSIGYPAWTSGNFQESLSDVLSNASGIGFSSNPHFKADGKLAEVPDYVYLQIDNIRLVF
jgi:hypothetical protein